MDLNVATRRRTASLNTPTRLQLESVEGLSGALNLLLADFFALYLKTKNFHWHVSGPHFATHRCSMSRLIKSWQDRRRASVCADRRHTLRSIGPSAPSAGFANDANSVPHACSRVRKRPPSGRGAAMPGC